MEHSSSFYFYWIFGFCLIALKFKFNFKSTIITNTTSTEDYDVALKSVECYSRIHRYDFRIIVDSAESEYKNVCRQNHKFFVRHCIISQILVDYDYVLFIDADHGVVNPKRKIEEFINPAFDLTFYDRFFDWEVMAGSYLVKNSRFSRDFLLDWANFEGNMSRITHGTDNSALHLILATHLLVPETNYHYQLSICKEIYYGALVNEDISTYIACIRYLLGSRTEFENIRILEKGTGWSRDDWLTSGIWNANRDFMLHGWKTKNLREFENVGSIKPIPMNYAHWYNPFAGPIDLEKCHPENSTWHYNLKLLGDYREIQRNLLDYSRRIERRKLRVIGRVKEILERT